MVGKVDGGSIPQAHCVSFYSAGTLCELPPSLKGYGNYHRRNHRMTECQNHELLRVG